MENTIAKEKPFTPNNLCMVLKLMRKNFPSRTLFWEFLTTPEYRRNLIRAANLSLEPRMAQATLLRFELYTDLIKATPNWDTAPLTDLPEDKQRIWQQRYYQLLVEDPELLKVIFPLNFTPSTA